MPGGNIAVIQTQADRTWMSKVEEPVRTKTLCHICRTLLSTGELLTTLTACASRSQEFHILWLWKAFQEGFHSEPQQAMELAMNLPTQDDYCMQ